MKKRHTHHSSGGAQPRRAGALAPEDAELWRRVTSDVRPINAHGPGDASHQSRDGTHGGNADGRLQHPRLRDAKSDQRRTRRDAPAPSVNANPNKPATGQRNVQSAINAGDPKYDRRVAKRRVEIDAVLDLHGFSARHAETAFVRFIENASREGARCVLIITGKGVTVSEASLDMADPYRAPRGVLRRRFVEWVDRTDLRPLIARAAPAKPKDGGGGAWYVFLKKRAR
ncbi:MAG: Smr/MutS family protein [Pseudomonadota bacterium]